MNRSHCCIGSWPGAADTRSGSPQSQRIPSSLMAASLPSHRLPTHPGALRPLAAPPIPSLASQLIAVHPHSMLSIASPDVPSRPAAPRASAVHHGASRLWQPIAPLAAAPAYPAVLRIPAHPSSGSASPAIASPHSATLGPASRPDALRADIGFPSRRDPALPGAPQCAPRCQCVAPLCLPTPCAPAPPCRCSTTHPAPRRRYAAPPAAWPRSCQCDPRPACASRLAAPVPPLRRSMLDQRPLDRRAEFLGLDVSADPTQ